MPLVGHSSLVADNPYHESKSDLLGPHGSGSHQVVASAENAAGQGVEVDYLVHDIDEPDISTEGHTFENNIFPTSPSGSPRSLSIHQPRHSLSVKIIVSSTIAFSSFLHRACQPRLNI